MTLPIMHVLNVYTTVPTSRVGLPYATIRTTLRYVCLFCHNYATELRYVIFCYVTELRIFLNKCS